MKKLAIALSVFLLVLVVEMWAFRIPPVGALHKPITVNCSVSDHFTGTTDPESGNAYIDFSESEKCSHPASLMSIHGTMYLDDAPAGRISRICQQVKACAETDYLTAVAPVTLQLKSNWAITLPKGFAFNLASLPPWCIGHKRAIACHSVSAEKTLG